MVEESWIMEMVAMAKKPPSFTNDDAGEVARYFVKCHGSALWRRVKPKIEVKRNYEKYVKDVLLMGVEIGVAETLKMIRDAADEA